MAYTKEQVEKAFPDIQWVGGKALLHIDGKNIIFGEQAAGDMVDPTEEGRALMETGDIPKRRGRKPVVGEMIIKE